MAFFKLNFFYIVVDVPNKKNNSEDYQHLQIDSFICRNAFAIFYKNTISILLFNSFFDSDFKLALDNLFALGRQLKSNILSLLLPIVDFLLRLII